MNCPNCNSTNVQQATLYGYWVPVLGCGDCGRTWVPAPVMEKITESPTFEQVFGKPGTQVELDPDAETIEFSAVEWAEFQCELEMYRKFYFFA